MEQFKLWAAQAAREVESSLYQATDIDKLARTVFAFEVVSHEVTIQGQRPNRSYQSVYDWVMTLSDQPTAEQEKVTKLKAFVKALLPFGNLAKELREYSATSAGARGAPKEVPPPFSDEFEEATKVLLVSPKASAALSRRCLQQLLREMAAVKPATLDAEIQQVLDSRALPLYLAEAIDAVRVVGNFAAHPIKSKDTGIVIAVEPGEAEWLLDVLEGLFDFYFVQPIRLQARKDALNAKLSAAGKPPLKSAF